MNLEGKVIGTALWLALFVTTTSSAQEPRADLAALLAEAEANNPEIAAARRTAEVAVARVPQAGALPDPMLGVGVMNFPVADPSLSREMMTMTTIQLSEQVPFFGKRGLREDLARFDAEAAQWEVERVRQQVAADVKAAYYRIYFVDRALDVTRRNETLVGEFAQLTSAKYGVGTGAQPDVLKAHVERTRLADQLVALREQRTSAVARLNAVLARPTDTPLPSPTLPAGVRIAALEEGDDAVAFTSVSLGDLSPSNARAPAPGVPTVAELQRLAPEHNPMILAHVRRVAARERAVALAEKARLPDFHLSVAYSRRPAFGDFVNFMVSVPVPVFAGRKQDQGVLEHAATLAQHQALHHAMVNRLNGEIASLAAKLERARAQLVLLNDGILPQARTTLASTTASYQVGRVDFLMLLDAQVTLYRHELEYHRLLADFAADLAALERAVGTEILK
ncbi:MAG TPA: TolC family protein [Longimicrobiales bacterium]|nr:TolC family protein [Longimicrobiales bacterium]